jgi:multiple sugar transport system permease protein
VTPGAGRPQTRAAWVFVGPALALIAILFFLPVLAGLLLALTDFDIYAIGSTSNARFVGLRNFQQILHNPDFLTALRNTLYYVIVGGPLSVLTSLGAALLLNARLVRLRGLFRTIYFAPVVTTLVAVAIVWRYLYHPRYGLLNYVLGWLGIAPVDWLGSPHWAMPAIILLSIWKNFGYNMLIFIAGLQAISQDLYEAAGIDGAGAWKRFVHVTLPGLAPTFLFVSVTTMIGFFQLFAEPYIMTQGGPLKSTTTLVLLMYQEGFRWWRMGIASTLAVVLLLATLVGTLLQLRLQRGRTQ